MSNNNTRFTDGVPRFHLWFSTGLGTGFAPWAPGTAGALLALILWYVLYLLIPVHTLFWVTLCLIVFTTIAGAWTSNVMEKYWGEDPRSVNIDEFVGTWIPLLAAPTGPYTWIFAIAGFALFRIIDIVKTPGCRAMEKIPNGWGVMMDDVLAGSYALIIIIIAKWLIFA